MREPIQLEEKLKQRAGAIASGILIAQQKLIKQYLDNPDLLPEEYKVEQPTPKVIIRYSRVLPWLLALQILGSGLIVAALINLNGKIGKSNSPLCFRGGNIPRTQPIRGH